METKPDPKRGPERRLGRERRGRDVGAPAGDDKRLAERRSGLERRRPHLHYDDLTPHPRPDRNINDYPLSTDEVEFINAINDYKAKFNRPFPTWSEVLHILRTMGYIREDAHFPVPAEGGPFDPAPPGPPPSAP
jgi:hypothetical protein